MPQSGWPQTLLSVLGVPPRLCGGPSFGELSGGIMNGHGGRIRYAGAVVAGRGGTLPFAGGGPSPSVNHLLPSPPGVGGAPLYAPGITSLPSGGEHARGLGAPYRG
jgi:hypothetical protein